MMAEETSRRAVTPSSNTASDHAGQQQKQQLNDAMGSPMPSAAARPPPDRHAAMASIVRRNYIYFTSLLQEPEAKWKHFSDNRGVTVTQLDSIDPTLVVYRAEATFVGVGVWDLYAAIANPGVKNAWDRGVEESRLIEDLGETSSLWWNKIRGAWPVAPRDSVTVETVYKSPSSIHVFAFSTDDKKLFPLIPNGDVGAIRTQTDLRGWCIESLSPTTAHITLIEQSDPKGWTSKASATPAAMTAVMAGVGDFAIRQGGPPIVTRLRNAKMRMVKYESDKASYRVEYELATTAGATAPANVECEIRCDVETWSPSLDMVIDPPPINVSCLRRHKLSQGGSGLWVTIEQQAASLEDDASRITVRKANNKEKGVVYVNGARMKVDVDEMKEDEVAQLREQKRSKPKRIPLDLPNESPRAPLVGSSPSTAMSISRAGTPASIVGAVAASANLAAVTGNSPGGPEVRTSSPIEPHTSDVFSDEKPRQPMTCALDVLFLLRRIHAERSPDPAGNPAGWSLVANRNGLFTRRKMMHSISPTVIVQRSDKVVEGLTAEDILSAVSNLSCRRLWDDKVDSATQLESYGNGSTSGFFTTKQSFPFRGRAFYLASLTARSGPGATQMGNPSAATVYFHASSSYPERNAHFSSSKLNPTALPMGKVLIDGWIVETLDPYSPTLNYQIPSTRVTHLIAVDYAGSLPVTVNAMWNSQLARSIVHVEEFLKRRGTLPAVRCPPSCVEVLGDGRDEDHGLIWTLEDDKSKRGCTMVSSDFVPATRVHNVVVALDTATHAPDETITPLAVPFPRRTALSTASTTRGLAAAATFMAPPSQGEFGAAVGREGSGISLRTGDEDDAAMSRATSVSSLRSLSSKSRPSVLRKETKKPTDFVVVGVEVELRHYADGYDIFIASDFGEAPKKVEKPAVEDDAKIDDEKAASGDGADAAKDDDRHVWPLNTASDASKSAALPLTVRCFDLPPSAVLAATLDPSARPKKHLVRLTLPTAAFLDARPNPLYGPAPDDAPEWYRTVRERGASVRVTLVPRKGAEPSEAGSSGISIASTAQPTARSGISTPSDSGSTDDGGEMDSQHVPVYYKGERMAVTHVNQTSAMLQRESEDEQPHAILKRSLPPPPPRTSIDGAAPMLGQPKKKPTATQGDLEDRLPLLLQRPIAVALQYGRAQGETNGQSGGLTASKSADDTTGLTPSSSGDVTFLKTPTGLRPGDTPRASSAQLPPANIPTSSTPTSAASAQIMGILNSYPLSRLGAASTAVSTTVANGGVFSRRGADANAPGGGAHSEMAADGSQVNGGTAGSKSAGAGEDEFSMSVSGMPGQLIVATEQMRKRMADVKFSWSSIVIVAIIAFLLGSLVRSLLEPADFVLVNRLTDERGTATKSGEDVIQAAAVREIKRAFEGATAPGHGHGTVGGNAAAAVGLRTEHTVAWRELKRLVELRNFFGGRWDLVIAVARR